MVNAILLLSVARNEINRVAQALSDIDGISEVFSVAGRYDLVAILRVADNEHLARLVTEEILKVEGITASETLISFRVFSQHDLEHMFGIGME